MSSSVANNALQSKTILVKLSLAVSCIMSVTPTNLVSMRQAVDVGNPFLPIVHDVIALASTLFASDAGTVLQHRKMILQHMLLETFPLRCVEFLVNNKRVGY